MDSFNTSTPADNSDRVIATNDFVLNEEAVTFMFPNLSVQSFFTKDGKTLKLQHDSLLHLEITSESGEILAICTYVPELPQITSEQKATFAEVILKDGGGRGDDSRNIAVRGLAAAINEKIMPSQAYIEADEETRKNMLRHFIDNCLPFLRQYRPNGTVFLMAAKYHGNDEYSVGSYYGGIHNSSADTKKEN